MTRQNLSVCAVVFFYTLNKLAENGHCYGEREQLVKKAKELLEVEEGEIEVTLDEMLRTKDVIQEEEAIYLPPYYFFRKRLRKAAAGTFAYRTKICD